MAGDDLTREVCQQQRKMAATQVYADDVASVGVEVQQGCAPTTSRRRLDCLPLEQQIIRQQLVNDATDGGTRESGLMRDSNTGDWPGYPNAIENQESIQLAHQAQ